MKNAIKNSSLIMKHNKNCQQNSIYLPKSTGITQQQNSTPNCASITSSTTDDNKLNYDRINKFKNELATGQYNINFVNIAAKILADHPATMPSSSDSN